MLINNHIIELIVNGKPIDLEDNLGITLDATLFDPSEMSPTEAEYSYSFTLPATKNNNLILNFGNALDRPNKFAFRFKAVLYIDEVEIFSGNLLINGFKDNEYQCNLVSPKVYNLEDIFGDSTLYDIDNWYLPFSGISSINEYNASNGDVTFPLVSYGVFEKTPYHSDDVANDYTDKFTFDQYNKWYVESFYPSVNMMSLVKHAFNWKGYNVEGDAFTDSNLKDIFLSTNLADEQSPVYNLANPLFGKVELTATITAGTDGGYEQQLNFPYFRVYNGAGNFYGTDPAYAQTVNDEAYNFDSIRIYDILKSGSTTLSQSYMYDPNEKCIVIPADGFYKIYLHTETNLDYTNTAITAAQSVKVTGDAGKTDIQPKDITMTIGLDEVTPVEIQLVRNYSDNIELIKGKWNKKYDNGDPTVTEYTVGNKHYNNVLDWLTCYPHEDPYASQLPTKTNDLSLRNTTSMFGGARTSGRTGSFSNPANQKRAYKATEYGYVPVDNALMCYDPVVNSDFILGASSMGKGQPAVIKNGYSWTASYSEQHNAYYNQQGYNKLYRNEGQSTVEESATTFNKNEYKNAPGNFFSIGKRTINGKKIVTSMYSDIYATVWLNRNDILELFEVHRAYNTERGQEVNYRATTSIRLRIEAISPKSKAYLDYEGFSYNTPSQFDRDLRITNFLNSGTTVSSYIQSVLDAFNLQMTQTGKNVSINKRRNPLNNMTPPVIDLDNRVKSADVESVNVEYPASIAVKYKIDTDEWGFETTVPKEKLNDSVWKDYGDYGYDEIMIDDSEYNVDNEEKSLNFSYTYYDDFKWYEVDETDVIDYGTLENLNIPVISKFTYMIPGYDYDEAMKHDGYGLTQRMWFRPKITNAFVWTDSYPTEKANIYIPKNTNNSLILNYKNQENSILRTYFNSKQNAANSAVKLKCYLSIDEYNLIKNGARIKFDSTVYISMNINYNVDDGEAEITLLKA